MCSCERNIETKETELKIIMKTIYTLILSIALVGLLPVRGAEMEKPATPKAPVAKKNETTSKTAPSVTTPKIALTPSQEDKLLTLLNKGTKEELDAINGIAATRAESIISARPFSKVHEIILVPGVGNSTFERILEHGKGLSQAGAKSGKS
jgi:DNA uptake protein ComE-like DNA-binding protein